MFLKFSCPIQTLEISLSAFLDQSGDLSWGQWGGLAGPGLRGLGPSSIIVYLCITFLFLVHFLTRSYTPQMKKL